MTPKRPKFNVLLYGDPGSGKTTLAASAQDSEHMRDVLFLNVEGGMLSVSFRGDLRAVDIESTDDVESIFWKVRDKKPPFESVSTVVIDSGTELQTLNLEEIVSDAMSKGKSTSRSGKERAPDDIWQEDYGRSTARLKRIFRQFKDLPINVIVTALAKYVYPKVADAAKLAETDPLVVMPSFTQKLGESLMGYVDFVWYTYYDQEDKKFKVLTRPQGPYRAKTRGPNFQKAIGSVITSPNMATLYDLFVTSESAGAQVNKPRRKKSSSAPTTSK